MRRAYRRIMIELLDQIVSANVPYAAPLPGVHDIAARHVVSPSVAREAVRALEERRVVAVRPGHGQHALAPEHWNVLDADVAEAVLVRHPAVPSVREAVEALRLVETPAAMLAARRATDADLALLDEAVAAMRASHDFPDAEARFHRTLMLLSGNRFLAATLAGLHPALARARHERAADRDPLAVRLHERIVAALRARDPTATAAAVEDYGRYLATWLGA
jgi:GntR family transcriptional repressor for pyruvate dehydrogenase complex